MCLGRALHKTIKLRRGLEEQKSPRLASSLSAGRAVVKEPCGASLPAGRPLRGLRSARSPGVHSPARRCGRFSDVSA